MPARRPSPTAAVEVTRREAASIATATLAATPVLAVPNSGGQTVNLEATVTVIPEDSSIQGIKYEWTFGDGSSATTNGGITSHVYTDPNDQLKAKTVTVTITLTNGQTLVASTQFLLGDF